MKILVTGANGFLGRYVVLEAVKRGHQVRAMVRPSSKNISESWQKHPNIEIVNADLRISKNLKSIMTGIDTVIHLAASKSGDLYEQFGGTVIATENLLAAMSASNISRLIMTSSFSVYEYMKRWNWSIINESSPLAIDPLSRDEYCQTKLVQERISISHAQANNWRCVVLRPGVIYGRNNLWTARLGMQISPRWWISTGMFATLPLTYVENCAEAIILAAEYNGSESISVMNVVDGKLPVQNAYINVLRASMTPRPRIIRVPWIVMRILARMAWLIDYAFFKGTAKIPGLFVPSRLHARCKPLFYSNKKISSILNWHPRYTWKEGVARSLSGTDLTSVMVGIEDESNFDIPRENSI